MVFALMVAPVLGLLAVSFARYDGLRLVWEFTTDNYQRVLSEEALFENSATVFGITLPSFLPIYLALILKSVLVSLAVTSVAVLIAFPVSIYLVSLPRRSRSLLLFLIALPFLTSYLLRIFAWKFLLGREGLINGGLMDIGVIHAPLEFLLYSPTAVAITMVNVHLTLAVIPIFLSMSKIDEDLYAASADLGDTPWRRFKRVTLPLSLPGVTSAVLLVLIPAAGDFVGPGMVGGTSGSMVGTSIASFFREGNDPPMGAALVVVSLIVVSLIALAVVALIGRFRGGVRQ